MNAEVKLEAENDQLKRDLLKYGAHTSSCAFSMRDEEKCICGFDEVKEQALMIIIKDQRRLFAPHNSPKPRENRK